MIKKRVLLLCILILVLVVAACDEDISSTNRSYTLQAEVLEGKGAIELEPDKDSYESGAEVEVRAKAETGYEFKSWSSVLNGQDNLAKIIVDDDLTIGAKFGLEEIVDKVEIMGSGVGTVIASEDEAGEKIYLAKAEEGSYFVGWKDDSNVTEVALDNGQGYLLPDGDYIAIFSEIRGNFAIDSDYENGKVELAPEKEEYSGGDVVTIEAKADDGYGFTRWQGDVKQLGEEGIKNHKLTLVIGEDIEEDEVIGLYPNFARQAGELTLDKKGEGEIELIPEQDEYKVGDEVEIKAIADEYEGYEFKEWSGDISGDTNPKTIIIEDNMNIEAVFDLKEYTVEFKDHEGTIKTIRNVKHGSNITDKAPGVRRKEGYEFRGWDNDLDDITSNLTVKAEFKIKTYEVEVPFAPDNGEIKIKNEAGEITNKFDYGETAIFEAKAKSGYKFNKWKETNNQISGNNNPIELTVTQDVTVLAEFEQLEYKGINTIVTKNKAIISEEDFVAQEYMKETIVVETEVEEDGIMTNLEYKGVTNEDFSFGGGIALYYNDGNSTQRVGSTGGGYPVNDWGTISPREKVNEIAEDNKLEVKKGDKIILRLNRTGSNSTKVPDDLEIKTKIKSEDALQETDSMTMSILEDGYSGENASRIDCNIKNPIIDKISIKGAYGSDERVWFGIDDEDENRIVDGYLENANNHQYETSISYKVSSDEEINTRVTNMGAGQDKDTMYVVTIYLKGESNNRTLGQNTTEITGKSSVNLISDYFVNIDDEKVIENIDYNIVDGSLNLTYNEFEKSVNNKISPPGEEIDFTFTDIELDINQTNYNESFEVEIEADYYINGTKVFDLNQVIEGGSIEQLKLKSGKEIEDVKASLVVVGSDFEEEVFSEKKIDINGVKSNVLTDSHTIPIDGELKLYLDDISRFSEEYEIEVEAKIE